MSRLLLTRIAQFAAVSLLGACGDGGTGPNGNGPATTPVVSTVVISTSDVTLTALGETVTLTAQASDASGNNVSGKTFTWTSSNAEVATVSSSGLVTALVTAVEQGIADITAGTDGVKGKATIFVAFGKLTYDIGPGVPQEDVDLIKEGFAIGQAFLESELAGGIPQVIRSTITVKIVATGAGNQEEGGGGACCTAYAQGPDGESIIRPFFDVLHPDWIGHSPATPWTHEASKKSTAVHEYTHGWHHSIGCATIFWQPLGAWMNEGTANYVAFTAMARTGEIEADIFADMLGAAFETGQMSWPLQEFGAVTSPIWPGHIGYVALNRLLETAPEGILALRTICEEVVAGAPVPAAFNTAFGVPLDQFYDEFDLWRQEYPDSIVTWFPPLPEGSGPVARHDHTAVYDHDSNRMVVFGGADAGRQPLSDVRVLTNANAKAGTPEWIPLNPSGGVPAGRSQHSAVYDETSDRMIIFGGSGVPSEDCDSRSGVFGDVWVLVNADGMGGAPNWVELTPTATPPPARREHGAVYDAGSNRMIVFGGLDPSGGALNDVWVLTNANGLGETASWIELTPAGTPPPGRWGHTAVYDAASNRMINYAGMDGNPGHQETNQVWVLTEANGVGGMSRWIELRPPDCCFFGERRHTAAVYDGISNRMTFVGGFVGVLGGPTNDNWVLSNANGTGGTPTWTQINLTIGGPPMARYSHSAIYDANSNRLVIFGGLEGSLSALDELWILTNANGDKPR